MIKNSIGADAIRYFITQRSEKRKNSDLWETPQWLYDRLNNEFRFDIDLCADQDNTKCTHYMADYLKDTPDDGYINACFSWISATSTAFMNPPYSNPKPFIEKAFRDSRRIKIVMLLKCDPSTSWWGIFWDYVNNKPKDGVEVRFLSKRLKFEKNGIPGGSASFPSAIVILDRRLI